MVYTVSITSQGQISIPTKVQKKLGIKKPGKAIMRVEAGKMIIESVKDLMELKGSLRTNKKPLSSNKLHEMFGEYLSR